MSQQLAQISHLYVYSRVGRVTFYVSLSVYCVTLSKCIRVGPTRCSQSCWSECAQLSLQVNPVRVPPSILRFTMQRDIIIPPIATFYTHSIELNQSFKISSSTHTIFTRVYLPSPHYCFFLVHSIMMPFNQTKYPIAVLSVACL
jgi:hypothetical protein